MKTKLYVIGILAVALLLTVGIASAAAPVGIPSCDFTAIPTTGSEDLTVTFTASFENIAPPVYYEWDFGDGTGAVKLSGPSITHTYYNTGKYDVRLAVYDMGLVTTWWVSNTKSGFITVTNLPPTAGFTFDPATGNAPLDVQFTSTTTGEAYTLEWDFGDNTTGSGKTPSHRYASKGTYTITLNATNDGGFNLASDTITVLPPAPVADFTATSSTTGAKPFAVQFENRSVYDGTITGFYWEFGNGDTSTGENPLYVYTNAGTYNVSLTVTTASGDDTVTKDAFVTVLNEPVICPTPEPTPEPTTCPTLDPIYINTTLPAEPVQSNIGIFRQATGQWVLDTNFDSGVDVRFLLIAGGMQLTGDFNGDGFTDAAEFKPASGMWYFDYTYDGTPDHSVKFGQAGDIPVVGDWDKDGFTEIGIFRPSTGNWVLSGDLSGTVYQRFHFGMNGDIPVVGYWGAP